MICCGSQGRIKILPRRRALTTATPTTHYNMLRTASSDQNTRLWRRDSHCCVPQFQVLRYPAHPPDVAKQTHGMKRLCRLKSYDKHASNCYEFLRVLAVFDIYVARTNTLWYLAKTECSASTRECDTPRSRGQVEVYQYAPRLRLAGRQALQHSNRQRKCLTKWC